jgi:hypothetical protein
VLHILFPNQTFGIPLANIHLFQIYAAILCDMLWFSRNKAIHKGVLPDASKFAEDINRISLDHHAAWKTKAQPMRELWSPPQAGNFKVNFNTAIRDLFSVQAAVCRDSTGAIVKVLYQYSPPSEASYDEAQVALLAAFLAISLKLDNFSLEGNSSIVISSIQ